MPSIFGDQDRGHHRLGRQPALDQPFRRWCLDHALFAGPAGVLGTMRHDHPILGGDDVETLGGVLPDPVLEAAAARAGLIRYIDDDLFARQMRWKLTLALTAAGAALALIAVPADASLVAPASKCEGQGNANASSRVQETRCAA